MSLLRKAGAGIILPDDLGATGEKATVDDVLDAAVAAWTALRFARGQARPIPDLQRRAGLCHLDL